jgi:hypothetical protein
MYANRLPLSSSQKKRIEEQAKSRANQVTAAARAAEQAARAAAAKAEAATKARERSAARTAERTAASNARQAAFDKVKPFNKRWATDRDRVAGVGKVYQGENFNYGETYCIHCKKKTGNLKPFQFIPSRMVNGKATRTQLKSKCSVCQLNKSTFVCSKQGRAKGAELGPGYIKKQYYPRYLGGGIDNDADSSSSSS